MSAKRSRQELRAVEVDGNSGGSLVLLGQSDVPGMCRIEVGCDCVITLSRDVSVVALADLITKANDTWPEILKAKAVP